MLSCDNTFGLKKKHKNNADECPLIVLERFSFFHPQTSAKKKNDKKKSIKAGTNDMA